MFLGGELSKVFDFCALCLQGRELPEAEEGFVFGSASYGYVFWCDVTGVGRNGFAYESTCSIEVAVVEIRDGGKGSFGEQPGFIFGVVGGVFCFEPAGGLPKGGIGNAFSSDNRGACECGGFDVEVAGTQERAVCIGNEPDVVFFLAWQAILAADELVAERGDYELLVDNEQGGEDNGQDDYWSDDAFEGYARSHYGGKLVVTDHFAEGECCGDYDNHTGEVTEVESAVQCVVREDVFSDCEGAEVCVLTELIEIDEQVDDYSQADEDAEGD